MKRFAFHAAMIATVFFVTTLFSGCDNVAITNIKVVSAEQLAGVWIGNEFEDEFGNWQPLSSPVELNTPDATKFTIDQETLLVNYDGWLSYHIRERNMSEGVIVVQIFLSGGHLSSPVRMYKQ